MNLLESIRWDCIEWNEKRSLTVTSNIFDSEVGQQIILNGQKGIYVASSGLGITIFDLFSEILQESDMKRFLRDHGKFRTIAQWFPAQKSRIICPWRYS